MQPKFTLRRLSVLLKLIPMVLLFSLSTGRTNAQCSWAAATAYPIAVLDQANVTVGSTLYSFGGVSASAVIANSYSFNGTTWTAIAPLPQALEYPAAVTDGVNIYILGGASSTGTPQTTLYRYNIATNNYTTLASFSTGVWNPTAVYRAGKIHKFAGTASSGSTNAHEIYDIATNTWSAGAPYPLAISFVSGFEHGGFVYAAGGVQTVGTVASAKAYRYDPVGNTWDDAAFADLPATRWGAASGMYSGQGILAGGYVGGSAASNVSNSAIAWDPAGNSWTTIANMLTQRARMNGALLSGDFYVIGGRCLTGACTAFQGTNDNQRLTCNFTPCSGTPNPGNTTSTANPVCPTIPFTLGIQNAQGPGTTYQWQSSPNGTTWTNIATANGSTYTTSITTTTWFRVIVTCTNGGATANSTPIQITINPPAACYCTPTYSAGCTLGDYIARVRLNTLDNSSLCSTPPFTYYSSVAAPTVLIGFPYQLIVNVGPDVFGQNVGAWIDYNIDGVFQTSEFLAAPINAGANGQATINFTVPPTATAGTTRLRIRGGDDLAMTAAQSCGPSNSPWGEAEDYNVIIAPCIQGAFTSQPQNATTRCSESATFSVSTVGSALTYEWEYRTSPTSPWLRLSTVSGPAPTVTGANAASTTLSNIPSGWNGYQFRAVISSPCTAPEFSNIATLTVNPLVATTNISSANICNGQIVQLTLTNASSTQTQTFSSGPINVPIPDNNPAGVNHTIPVTLPASSVVSQVVVTFDIPNHTWPGDLAVVLRAPNGQILNLDYFISATGAGPGNGMFQTKISSAGGPLLSSVAPSTRYTGTFRADAVTAGSPAPGPTGFAPTTNSWTPLMASGGTGNWTLAVYDAFGLDVGTLMFWSLDITYGSPAAGTWTASPATPNTMFTDPAATIPYTGGPANTIYVRPSVNTTYCVVYSTTTPPCTSAPTCIPVNVFNPVSNLVAPSNTTVCNGTTATFTASASGGPITWQWQVSVDGGVTWSNVPGATAATLTVPNVTMQMNNNRYRVVATSSACASTVTSAAAVLTVNALPTVNISATNTQLVPGGTATLTATSSPAAAANGFIWFRGTDTVRDASGNVIRGNNIVVDIDDIGSYSVRVTDVNGCVNRSSNLVIGTEFSDRLWIYPNPTNDGRFQVRWFYDGVTTERRKVSIYTLTGQKVAEKEFDLTNTTHPYLQMDFDLRHVSNGTYVVKVLNKFHEAVKSGLVVIQR
ncbi:MAG TPA: GEVED domain-containing protein [Chitinophagaceae bacterium]|nr:GEVED domain-containing protein [Chitinophagaceae bacterium]